jgi:hypothetical protein
MFTKKKSTEPEPYRTPSRDLPGRQNIYTYYKSRSIKDENQSRQSLDSLKEQRDIKLKKNNFRIQRSTKAAAVLCLIMVLLIADLILSNSVNIDITNQSEVSGIYMRPVNIYQQAADKLLRASIANRIKATVNTTKIEEDMLQQFPELANVSIRMPLIGTKLTIVISPVSPAIILNDQSGLHFLVGQTGKTLRPIANSYIKDFSIPTVNDQTALQAQIGKQVVTQTDVSFIELITAQFQAHKINIQSMALLGISRELDVYLTGTPYFVKFNLTDFSNANLQIGTYLATRNFLIDNHITPTQYVDTRIPDRVFYK